MTTNRQETKTNRDYHFITEGNRQDAQELLSSRPSSKKFPKIIFSEDATKIQTPTTLKVKMTEAVLTEDNSAMAGTQSDNPQAETNEHCVSRVNPKIVIEEECAPSEEPPLMTITQLEASYHMITDRIRVTIKQATMTESEEDTPLFR